VEYLEFTHSDGVEMDFHFAIDVVTDLAAILLECSVSRITATAEEHDAMNKALADFAQNPLEYDLSEMMDEDGIQEMARDMLQVEYPNGFLLDMESRSAVAN